MYNFNVTLFNKKQKIWENQSIESMTFAEAARTAYMMRNRRGFDWEIQSVTRVVKDKID